MSKKVWAFLVVCVVLVPVGLTITPGISPDIRVAVAAEKDLLGDIIERGVIRVGSTAAARPYCYRDETGKIVGWEIDLANLIAENLGVKLENVDMPWAGLIPALQAGRIDLISPRMLTTLERAKSVWFCEALHLAATVAYARKESGFTSWEELNLSKYTVGAISGAVGEELAKKKLPNAQLKLFQLDTDATQALLTGRVDAVCNGNLISAGEVQAYPDKLVVLPGNLRAETTTWAVKQGSPQLSLKFWMDNFVRKIKITGQYGEICKKWMGEAYVPWNQFMCSNR